jgi:hypothetical protein
LKEEIRRRKQPATPGQFWTPIAGQPWKPIDTLGISEITVKAHRGRLMRKMQAHSLAALVHMAMRLGVAQEVSV